VSCNVYCICVVTRLFLLIMVQHITEVIKEYQTKLCELPFVSKCRFMEIRWDIAVMRIRFSSRSNFVTTRVVCSVPPSTTQLCYKVSVRTLSPLHCHICYPRSVTLIRDLGCRRRRRHILAHASRLHPLALYIIVYGIRRAEIRGSRVCRDSYLR
jgi:hypothetical protein